MSMGTVTWRKVFHRPAPSMSAASYRAAGIACSPASTIIAKKPSVAHTWTKIAQNMAQSARSSQGCRGSPRPWRMAFSTPNWLFRIHCQTRATTTGDRSTG